MGKQSKPEFKEMGMQKSDAILRFGPVNVFAMIFMLAVSGCLLAVDSVNASTNQMFTQGSVPNLSSSTWFIDEISTEAGKGLEERKAMKKKGESFEWTNGEELMKKFWGDARNASLPDLLVYYSMSDTGSPLMALLQDGKKKDTLRDQPQFWVLVISEVPFSRSWCGKLAASADLSATTIVSYSEDCAMVNLSGLEYKTETTGLDLLADAAKYVLGKLYLGSTPTVTPEYDKPNPLDRNTKILKVSTEGTATRALYYGIVGFALKTDALYRVTIAPCSSCSPQFVSSTYEFANGSDSWLGIGVAGGCTFPKDYKFTTTRSSYAVTLEIHPPLKFVRFINYPSQRLTRCLTTGLVIGLSGNDLQFERLPSEPIVGLRFGYPRLGTDVGRLGFIVGLHWTKVKVPANDVIKEEHLERKPKLYLGLDWKLANLFSK
jgi:hypothetical protein